MVVPTRIIERDEFMELSKMEGDVFIVHSLTNIPFAPPVSADLPEIKSKQASINILLMNVTEPVIYKDKSGDAFVIMNGYDDSTFTYENFRDVHFIKDSHNAWGYRLSPSYWDEDDFDDDLDVPIYVFKHESRDGQSMDGV